MNRGVKFVHLLGLGGGWALYNTPPGSLEWSLGTVLGSLGAALTAVASGRGRAGGAGGAVPATPPSPVYYTTVTGGGAAASGASSALWAGLGCLAVGSGIWLVGLPSFLGEWMWVTESKFGVAIKALKDRIRGVYTALGEAKDEILAKVGIVEEKLTTAQNSLEGRLDEHFERLEGDVDAVRGEMRAWTDESRGRMVRLQRNLDEVKSHVESSKAKLDAANQGIYLLCSFALHGRDTPQFEELEAFYEASASSKKPRIERGGLAPGLKMIIGSAGPDEYGRVFQANASAPSNQLGSGVPT